MATANYRTEYSEEESLFRSYPYALYYVQSPSTASHANYDVHSPPRSDQEATRLALSRYSSSRGSNNSFLQDQSKKKLHSAGDDHVPENAGKGGVVVKPGVDFAAAEEEEEEYDYDYGDQRNRGFSIYRSGIVSLINCVSLSMIAGIRQFRLGEGVDGSGVATKILSCNCSIHVVIDNNSKLFALHIHPPIMEMLFARLPLAISQGREVYAGSSDLTLLRLSVGTRNKAMYGAGRNMEDMLESGEGLGLVIRVRLRSSFHVIWGIVKPKYEHEAQCLVVVGNKYDKKHRTQVYNSTCVIN
ncbi:UNVERIFIED_CONTAM: hypothetical protein Sradi_1096100 [Sesamum radiatum]|uniref:Uncharacterized protein n=1 Tax=Sesamum radiatum TaxID=300843 RepID=A0AAW2V9G2_SESRA